MRVLAVVCLAALAAASDGASAARLRRRLQGASGTCSESSITKKFKCEKGKHTWTPAGGGGGGGGGDTACADFTTFEQCKAEALKTKMCQWNKKTDPMTCIAKGSGGGGAGGGVVKKSCPGGEQCKNRKLGNGGKCSAAVPLGNKVDMANCEDANMGSTGVWRASSGGGAGGGASKAKGTCAKRPAKKTKTACEAAGGTWSMPDKPVKCAAKGKCVDSGGADMVVTPMSKKNCMNAGGTWEKTAVDANAAPCVSPGGKAGKGSGGAMAAPKGWCFDDQDVVIDQMPMNRPICEKTANNVWKVAEGACKNVRAEWVKVLTEAGCTSDDANNTWMAKPAKGGGGGNAKSKGKCRDTNGTTVVAKKFSECKAASADNKWITKKACTDTNGDPVVAKTNAACKAASADNTWA